jgi:hypothetical protein
MYYAKVDTNGSTGVGIYTNDNATSGCETDGCVGTLVSDTSASRNIADLPASGVVDFPLSATKTLSAGTYWTRGLNIGGKWSYGKIRASGGLRAWDGSLYYNSFNVGSSVMGCNP